MIRMVELFAGIGAQAMALEELGIPFTSTVCEIDKAAYRSYCAIHGDTPNLGDITRVEHLPDCDLLTYSYPCLRGDQIVPTMRGPVPIKDIVIGDEVLTHRGRFRKVTAVRMTGRHGVMKVGTPVNTLVCTRDHMILTRFKLKPNGHPRKSDGSVGRTFTPAYWAPAISLTRDNYVGYPVNTVEAPMEWDEGGIGGKGHTVSIRDKLNDASFWWLCGRYVADGWLRTGGGISIALGKGKEGDIERLRSVFHVSCTEERTVLRAHIHLQKVGEFCDEMFGHGASEKHIDRRVLNLPRDLLRAFLEGYVSGDGHLCDDGSITCSSVSERLIRDLQEAVIKVYRMVPKYNFTKRPETTVIEGRVVHQQDSHCLKWKTEARKQDKSFYEDGILWHPVRETEVLGPCNTYDISVEEDHSFVASGVIVHNCQDLSIAGLQRGMTEGSGTRSSLLWEVGRLLTDAQERGRLPEALLMENVNAVLNRKNIAEFNRWIDRLKAMGYTSSYAVLNAKDYGVPQSRKRCFMVSTLKGRTFRFPEPCPDGRVLKDVLEDDVPESFYLSDEKVAVYERHRIRHEEQGHGLGWRPSPPVGVAHAIGTNRDRPNQNFVIEIAGHIESGFESTGRVYSESGLCPTLNTFQGGHRAPKIERDTIAYPTANRKGFMEASEGDGLVMVRLQTARGTVKKGMAPVLTAGKGCDTGVVVRQDDSDRIPDLEEGEIAAMPTPGHMAERQQGRRCKTDGASSAVTCAEVHGIAGNDRGRLRIRYLTPRECWRLMGFPDEAFDRAQAVPTSKTQLYKQAGNSIAVPCLKAIFKGMYIDDSWETARTLEDWA